MSSLDHEEPLISSKGNCPLRAKKGNLRSNNLQRVSYIAPSEEFKFLHVVRQTRMLFESLRMHLSTPSSSLNGKPDKKEKGFDKIAGSNMLKRDLWLNRDKRIVGSLPGICIGDVFFYRMEMCVIGLHGQPQAGIDSLTASLSSTGYSTVISIVISGRYKYDLDNGDEVMYTHPHYANNTNQTADQKLEGNNCAMKGNMVNKIEVRLFRGFDYLPSPSKRIYVYEGVYNVVDCYLRRDESELLVYQSKLLRKQGQEKLGSEAFQRAEKIKCSDIRIKSTHGYVKYDLSNGEERIPISVFNDIDKLCYPLKCKYLAKPTLTKSIGIKVDAIGCECAKQCKSNDCTCIVKNGGPVYNDNGKLIKGKPVIYECGEHCRCSSSCGNRVTEKGLRHSLEIFRSTGTLWGVRSLDLICAGQFICELSGVILTKEEGEVAHESGRDLVHPRKFPERWREWGDLSKVGYESNSRDDKVMTDVGYVIDVTELRNVGCYICHSSCPNVFVQYVLNDHNDMRYPRVMVFAMDNIPPMRELRLEYGD